MKERIVFVIMILLASLSIRAQSQKEHVVQRGETLDVIAQKYGISKNKIIEANPQTLHYLYAGMKLIIPCIEISSDNNRNIVDVSSVDSVSPYKGSWIQGNLKKHHNLWQLPFSYSIFLNVSGGYSNYKWDDGSPKSSLGLGVDVSGQIFWQGSIVPKDYFAEFAIGYSRKGSGAYPMGYICGKVLPLGYSFDNVKENMSIFLKGGFYAGIPISKVETKQNTYKGNFDYGVIVGVGLFIDNKFSVMLSIEEGLAKICDSPVDLKNETIMCTVSYRIKKVLPWMN